MLLNDVRQEILQDVLASSGRMTTPMVEGSPYLVPYAFVDEDALSLYLVNGALDAADSVTLRMPEQSGAYALSVLPSRGEPCAFFLTIEQGRCVLPISIQSMESALVTMRKQNP